MNFAKEEVMNETSACAFGKRIVARLCLDALLLVGLYVPGDFNSGISQANVTELRGHILHNGKNWFFLPTFRQIQ